MPTPSLNLLLAAYAETTSRQAIGLLTINVTGVGTRRYCTGGIPLTSNGNLFSPLWFDVRLPSIEGGALRSGELVLDNTGEQPLSALLQSDNTTRAIRVIVEVVIDNQLDSVQHRSEWQIVPSLNYGVGEIRCRLGYDTVLDDEYPQVKFSPGSFAGAF